MSFLSTSIADAIARLKAGALVALPTETVYGLAADACDEQAVSYVFALKGRPSNNPLIIHVADIALAKRYVQGNDLAEALAAAQWAGALTLVLPKAADCPVALSVSAGGQTLAIRMPSHPLMREVLQGFGGGVAAPSANRSGRISPTQAAHVQEEFPDADLMVLEGGACAVGVESTVVDCTGEAAKVLRAGSVLLDDASQIAAAVTTATVPLASPGMLSSHYAPSLPVRLNVTHVQQGEALLAFGAPLEGSAQMLNLSEAGDVDEAASHLFAMLRALDCPKYRAIAVMPIPEEGVGIAINDRLKRAAADRL